MAEPPTPHEVILDSATDGVFTVNGQWTMTSYNRAGEALEQLMRRSFPRNIRELQNIVECAVY